MQASDQQGPSSMICSNKKMLGAQTTRRRLHDDLIFDAILTRLPPTAVVCCRAVCRAWHEALTSDNFVRAYAAVRQPELLFFAPADASTSTGSTTLYTCALRNDDGEAPPRAARELLTLGNLNAEHVVVSPRPCHGLTLVSDGRTVEHYVCNLSTGEHVALPPCERAAAVDAPDSMRIGVAGRCLRPPPWTPFEIASTGLGFDPATGEHKVVRLFKRRIGETGCEVCVPGPGPGAAWAWRRCAGRVPPSSASFVAGLPPVYLSGSLYWLLELNSFTGTDQPVMSFSVGDEQFGWVQMPPYLAQRVGTLTELDGSLCAVVDLRYDHERYSLYTWGGGGDDTWSKRYSIDLQSLPQAISDEFVEEDDVIPLCSCSSSAAAGGSGEKLLLATGFHKVFAYDPNSVAMERVLWMQEFVDVPGRCQEASFLLQFGLYKDSIASVHRHSGSSSKLQVKLGTSTVGKRQVSHVYRQARSRKMRDFLKHFRKEMAGRMNNG